MISIFNKRVALRLGQLLLAAVGIVAGVMWAQWILTTDPFAQLRRGAPEGLSEEIGVRLKGVDVKMYEHGTLVGSAKVGTLDIRRDRNRLAFHEVADGMYRGADGEFRFASPAATYDSSFRRLEVGSGGRIWNEDMDLKVLGAVYQGSTQVLQTSGLITGRFMDGSIEAENLLYRLDTGAYRVGPITWVGEVEIPAVRRQDKPQTQKWTIKALGAARAKGDLEFYENVEATDGEVIVKAPKGSLNRKTDVFEATGPVEYFGIEANLRCDKIVIFRAEKRAVLTGNVTLVVKPKENQKLEVMEIPPFRPVVPEEVAKNRPQPQSATDSQRKDDDEVRSGQTIRKYPILIAAEKIEYWYAEGSRRAIITGKPQARQELPEGRWRHLWAPRGLYDGEEDTLRMIGAEGKREVRIMTSVGDDLVAEWFEVATAAEEDSWQAWNITGTVAKEPDQGKPPPTGPTGPIGHR